MHDIGSNILFRLTSGTDGLNKLGVHIEHETECLCMLVIIFLEYVLKNCWLYLNADVSDTLNIRHIIYYKLYLYIYREYTSLIL